MHAGCQRQHHITGDVTRSSRLHAMQAVGHEFACKHDHSPNLSRTEMCPSQGWYSWRSGSTGGGAAEAKHRRVCSRWQLSESCNVVWVNLTVRYSTLFQRSPASAEGRIDSKVQRVSGRSDEVYEFAPSKRRQSAKALQHSSRPHHLHAYIKPRKRHGRQGKAKGGVASSSAPCTT